MVAESERTGITTSRLFRLAWSFARADLAAEPSAAERIAAEKAARKLELDRARWRRASRNRNAKWCC